jgi:predicted Rossmann fold nucleotide-binding protein DprA/Smf involved in DNA uptake
MAVETPRPADSSSSKPTATPSAAPSRPKRTRRRDHAASPQHEDRLKRALQQLPPGQHSTARIAKAAGLNQAKVLSRLQALEAAGEVERIGKHWSTEPRSTDLEAAFARLEARTGNLRIIRPRGADS